MMGPKKEAHGALFLEFSLEDHLPAKILASGDLSSGPVLAASTEHRGQMLRPAFFSCRPQSAAPLNVHPALRCHDDCRPP